VVFEDASLEKNREYIFELCFGFLKNVAT